MPMKDELLRLIDEDPEVRAKVQGLAKTAEVAEPVFHGPGWLHDHAAHPLAGPHTRSRLSAPGGAR